MRASRPASLPRSVSGAPARRRRRPRCRHRRRERGEAAGPRRAGAVLFPASSSVSRGTRSRLAGGEGADARVAADVIDERAQEGVRHGGFSSWRKWPAPVTGSWRRKKVICAGARGRRGGRSPEGHERLLVGRLQRREVLGEEAVVGELAGATCGSQASCAPRHARGCRGRNLPRRSGRRRRGRTPSSLSREAGRRARPSRRGRRSRGAGRP